MTIEIPTLGDEALRFYWYFSYKIPEWGIRVRDNKAMEPDWFEYRKSVKFSETTNNIQTQMQRAYQTDVERTTTNL